MTISKQVRIPDNILNKIEYIAARESKLTGHDIQPKSITLKALEKFISDYEKDNSISFKDEGAI